MNDDPLYRSITVATGVITIINFLFTFVGGLPPVSIPTIEGIAVPARLGIFFVLESTLSYGFGFVFKLLLDHRDSSVHQLFGGLMIGTLSAWVSFFNISVFVVSGLEYHDEAMAVLFIVAIATLIPS